MKRSNQSTAGAAAKKVKVEAKEEIEAKEEEKESSLKKKKKKAKKSKKPFQRPHPDQLFPKLPLAKDVERMVFNYLSVEDFAVMMTKPKDFDLIPYMPELPLAAEKTRELFYKTVGPILKDISRDHFKILVARNWLAKDIVTKYYPGVVKNLDLLSLQPQSQEMKVLCDMDLHNDVIEEDERHLRDVYSHEGMIEVYKATKRWPLYKYHPDLFLYCKWGYRKVALGLIDQKDEKVMDYVMSLFTEKPLCKCIQCHEKSKEYAGIQEALTSRYHFGRLYHEFYLVRFDRDAKEGKVDEYAKSNVWKEQYREKHSRHEKLSSAWCSLCAMIDYERTAKDHREYMAGSAMAQYDNPDYVKPEKKDAPMSPESPSPMERRAMEQEIQEAEDAVEDAAEALYDVPGYSTEEEMWRQEQAREAEEEADEEEK